MSRIEKSLKNFFEKMVGEKPNGDCICSIIDDAANKCEAGGGNGGGGGALYIEEEYNESEDMSYPTVPYEEIVSAFDAGKTLYFKTSGSNPFIIPLAYVEDDTFVFQYITGYDLNVTIRNFRINENGVFFEEQLGQLKARATES